MSLSNKEELKPVEFHFDGINSLTYLHKDTQYEMKMTKNQKPKLYFGCINRHRTSTTTGKCGVTGIYDTSSKSYTLKREHTAKCGEKNDIKYIIDSSYEIQREIILNRLIENPWLTPGPILELLRLENSKKRPEEQLRPLTYDQVKYIIQEFRKDNGITKEVSLNSAIVLAKDNSLFLRYQSSLFSLHKGNIVLYKWLIFASPWQLALLSNSTHWFLDGTFFSVPTDFYQLINISIYDQLSGLYIPLLWALSTHKSYDIYVNMFWDVAKFLSKQQKLRITCDFEEKLGEALKFIFESELCGCYYHFSECLNRKAQKLGILPLEYKEKTIKIISNLKSLCFSNKDISKDLELMKKEFEDKQNLPVSEEEKTYFKKIVLFLEYFIKTWLPKYKKKMINYSQIDQRERTNNSLEAYYGQLQSKLIKNPTLDKLINVLKEEEYAWFLRQQEILRHSSTQNFSQINRKRKIDDISNSQEKSQEESSPETNITAPQFGFSPQLKKLKKHEENSTFQPQTPSLTSIKEPNQDLKEDSNPTSTPSNKQWL